MGIHLVDILESNGYYVTVTSRKERVSSSRYVRFKIGDAKNIKFVQTLIEDQYDIIIDFMVYSTEEFKNRYQIFLSHTTRYVYFSSARVYAESSYALVETSPRLIDLNINNNEYFQTDEYALAKGRQENMLFDSSYRNWTIIRPYITFSENRLQLGNLEKENWLYRLMTNKTLVFSKDILDKYTTLTYGYDVAFAISRLIFEDNTLGEAFHITNNKSIKWEKVLQIYLSEFNRFTNLDSQILFQTYDNYIKWNENKYQIDYDRLFDRSFDNSKVSKYVDTSKFMNPEEGLKMCIKEVMTNNDFLSINGRQFGKLDKISHNYTELKEFENMTEKINYLIFRTKG